MSVCRSTGSWGLPGPDGALAESYLEQEEIKSLHERKFQNLLESYTKRQLPDDLRVDKIVEQDADFARGRDRDRSRVGRNGDPVADLEAVADAERNVERARDEATYELIILYQQAWLAQAEREVDEREARRLASGALLAPVCDRESQYFCIRMISGFQEFNRF